MSGFGDKISKDDLSGYFEKFGTIMMLLCVMINKQERQGASDLSTSIPRKLRTGALPMTMVECTHPTTDHLSLGVALI